MAPPDVIVYYSAPEYLKRVQPAQLANGRHLEHVNETSPLDEDNLLDALKALSDVNRLRIVELLAGRSMIARVKVSDSGHFSVHQLEPGRYRLRIRREDDKEVLFEQDVAVPTHYMLILGLKEPGAGGLP